MIKRFIDILFSTIGLLIFMPFLLIIAVVIVLDSKGGIFYRQKRVGKNEKEFRLLKFRTMHTDADKKSKLTIGNRDPRITKVGYYLRKLKIDELPQLINVILGDMSLVGPRPEVKKYVDLYTDEQKKVLTVKPGITDYASIMYINENEILGKSKNPEETYINEIMPEKLAINLKYVYNNNPLEDMKIIFQTIFKIFK